MMHLKFQEPTFKSPISKLPVHKIPFHSPKIFNDYLISWSTIPDYDFHSKIDIIVYIQTE